VKLAHVHIASFRSIRSAHLRVEDELALVGQNSSGKTSVLRALNAFFNFDDERLAFESGQHAFQSSSFATIEVTLKEVPHECTLVRTTSSDEIRARLRFRKQAQWQILDQQTWVAAPTNLHEELRKFISYAFVPLRRDHEIAGWGPGGLMERVVEASVRTSRQRDHITPGIQRLGDRLQKQSLDKLVARLREKTPLRGRFEYTLGYDVAPDYSVLLKNLILHVREGNHVVSLADSGSGTQSLAVFALYSYLADIENSTYILGFEEPEQNLHPQAQIQLLAQLKSLDLQVIFTTHSPTMIDALDHEQVALCRRVVSPTRAIETTVSQLPSDFFTSRSLNREAYYRFHSRKNSEFFFADFVVVTESPIDAAVISEMMKQAGVSLAESNISLLSLDGVTSIDYVYHLLRGLDVECMFVVDKDYFLPYVHGELDKSRNSDGYPVYQKSLKSGTLVPWLLPNKKDQNLLVDDLYSRHSTAAVTLKAVGFYCFRWSLEMDLVAAATTRGALCTKLGISLGASGIESQLLISNKKALKRQDVLIAAVAGSSSQGLPGSYRTIRTTLRQMVKRLAHER
jgi:putative ATP-dependent endonuclease of OLD family